MIKESGLEMIKESGLICELEEARGMGPSFVLPIAIFYPGF